MSQEADARSGHNMRRTLIIAPFVFCFPLAILVSNRTSTEIRQTNIATPINFSGFRLRATLSGLSVRLGYGWSAPMAFSSGGDSLAVGSHGGSITLWDVRTGELRATLSGHERWTSELVFAQDRRVLASASGDRTAKLWDTETGKLLASFNGHKSRFMKLSLSADGRLLATASDEDKSPRIWDTKVGRLVQTLPRVSELHSVAIGSIAFSPTGPTLATTTWTGIYLWDAETGKLRATLVDQSLSRTVRVIEHRHSEDRVENFSHADTIYRILFSPDGRVLATGSRDFTAKLWDVTNGQLKATLKHDGKVIALAFSEDGKTLATGSGDSTARLWNVETGEMLATLPHRGTVWSLSFSPDGKLIATGSDNEKAVSVWDAATGKLIERLSDSRYPVAFSPDGRTLATAKWGLPGTVLLWDVPMR